MTRPNNPTVDEHGLLAGEAKVEKCSELTRKLIELEYAYAKENALLTISQRGSMMRVYLAIVAILIAGAFALLRDESVNGLDLPILTSLSVILVCVSVYYMKGLTILRSDWYDYVKAMSHLKIYVLNSEEPKVRSVLVNSALMFHPENIPPRNLTTNFFFHSFAICMLIAGLSSFCLAILLIAGTGYTGNLIPSAKHTLLYLILSGLFVSFASYLTAVKIWRRLLR